MGISHVLAYGFASHAGEASDRPNLEQSERPSLSHASEAGFLSRRERSKQLFLSRAKRAALTPSYGRNGRPPLSHASEASSRLYRERASDLLSLTRAKRAANLAANEVGDSPSLMRAKQVT